MSFFFSQKKTKPAKRAAPVAASASKASKDTLNRLGCKACPLDKAKNFTPKMKPILADSDIYILGDYPNDEDDQKGRPFSGEAGKLLKSVIGSLDNYSIDSAIRDYIDTAAHSTLPNWVPMECCRGHVVKSVEHVRPRLIIGLGIIPLQWMLNSSDMVGLRGRIFAVKIGSHACWFMPTYHPQYIIDKAYEKDEPLKNKLGHCFKFDLERALRLAAELPDAKIDTPQQVRAAIQTFNGKSPRQLAQVLGLISEARRAAEKAIDLETQNLRPYAADSCLLTVAISFKDTNFAFGFNHPSAGWNKDEKKQIKEALIELLSDETVIISHNASFEIEWLIANLGKEVIWHDAWECTMMQSHFIDERRGKRGGNDEQFQPNPYQALDFLVKQYFGISYKSVFKVDRKNMIKSDLDETLLYNGADTKYTLRLNSLQKAELKRQGLWEAYREALPRQPAVALMQSIGIPIDQTQNKLMQVKLGEEIKKITTEIFSYPEVEDYVRKHRLFNPASQPDVIKLFKENFGFEKIIINDEGRETVDKNTLAKIDHPIGRSIEAFRNRSKLKSTYVDVFEIGKGQFIWPDGKIHPSFNTTFAETGRTSCTAHWTPVVTARGEIPIREVQVGDLVWTHKERWKPVTALWRKGWEIMFNLKLSNGSVLTCTKNHRLLTPSGWKTVGEIYGLFQEMGKQPSSSGLGAGTLPQQGIAASERNSNSTKNYKIQHLVDNTQLLEPRRIQGIETAAVLNVKDWRQESHEGKDRGIVAQLERDLRRRVWVQNHQSEWETNILSSLCYDEGDGTETAAKRLARAPCGRRPSQQPHRQFSPCNKQGARGYPLKANGFKIVTIEEIEVGRSCEVFDITVADDASYLTCGVISHNSDEPNQQNWPNRQDNWVRKQVVAPAGHVLVAFDYGQLEACTSAMCTKDRVLIKSLWEDYDIHMEWAIKVAHRWPDAIGGIHNLKDKAVMKKFRSLVKNKLVFPVIFGASNDSVSGYLNIPIEPVNKLMDEFWGTFGGIYRWQRKLMMFYYENGFVESPTGRRRHYPLTKNQAINYPIQSVACDIVCRAMVTLSVHAASTGKWYLHPIMNIHDDLTFAIPDDDKILEESISKIYKVMLAPVYDFINVPLSVTCSIGKNWLDMTEIQKFWSHKDL
jgi:uracil-DNA glycosylase family 4